ncbi:MAG: SDR family NAD(P)-dependent oxidoreductase, partial [Hyphomicrobiales bacterium]|nr:SDR family NAD(P)-dependent oxidoreductase [Hyphomicrobiales bacterium]
MEVRLDGKVVLVTGASQGIGEAIADLAARSGAAGILISDRDAPGGADVAARLSTDGVAIEFVEADLLDNATPTRLVSQCVDRFGRIDCLVNA